MISRIRVETRAETMEEAERDAVTLLDHARQAGVLEGIAPHSSRFTDSHFENVMFKRSPTDDPEPWNELGLPYAGRITITFDPETVKGGLKEYGFKVVTDESQVPAEARSSEDGRDVTDEVMVLNRQRPVTREHTWENASSFLAASERVSAEAILVNIRNLISTRGGLKVEEEDGAWSVTVEVADPRSPGGWRYAEGSGGTLWDAAIDCYGKCGTEVMHYDTVQPATAEFTVTLPPQR